MIHKNWAELIKPAQLEVKQANDPTRQGTVIAEPLERGFGLTIGNALRRVLMSSLQGAAITSVQIDNVLHEFSSVAGVREDVTDIVLNLKGVSLNMEVEGPKRLSVSSKGPGVVTAGDIEETAGIEILNKDHVICHLDNGADLNMELTVNTGNGYVAAEKNKPEDAPIGLIPIDAIYSPVKKVSYDVQPTREGQVLDYDKLTINIETDGSVSPDDALAFAARILQDQLSIFVNFDEPEAANQNDEDDGLELAGVLDAVEERQGTQPIDSVRGFRTPASDTASEVKHDAGPREPFVHSRRVGEVADHARGTVRAHRGCFGFGSDHARHRVAGFNQPRDQHRCNFSGRPGHKGVGRHVGSVRGSCHDPGCRCTYSQ